MKRIFLPGVLVVILIIFGLIFFYSKQKPAGPEPETLAAAKEIKPSETMIDYEDPSGFSFSYPDNLSIEKNAEPDLSSYADLQLFSKDKNGSLAIQITDTKLKTLEGWLKDNQISDSNILVEKKLGNLNAIEVKTSDRVMLAALDQGILFSVQMPLVETEFWNQVYDKVIAGLNFALPETTTTAAAPPVSEEEVFFEGEEVVE